MDISIIYCTTNKINGKKYIGSHNKRKLNYLGSGTDLKQAIKKYGKENFTRQILWEGPSEFKYEMEEYWCNYFNVANNPTFYNRTNKGFGMVVGFKYNNDQKQLMSNNHKKLYYQYSLDGEFIKEWKGTDDIFNKLGIGRGDISSCCKGKQKTAGGFIWSYKLEKINLNNNQHKNGKSINQYTLDGEFIKTFNSTKEAEKYLNKTGNNIASCANGKQKSAYGYLWVYN
jgi:group I intron endonuclease